MVANDIAENNNAVYIVFISIADLINPNVGNQVNIQSDIDLFVKAFITNNKAHTTSKLKLTQSMEDCCFIFFLDSFTTLISL